MMTCVAVVTLNSDRVGFADDMSFFGKDFRKGIPVICIEETPVQVFDFLVEAPKGCSITTAEHPGHGSL